jgi:hypothetical protein
MYSDIRHIEDGIDDDDSARAPEIRSPRMATKTG